jgi:hypothetical protein
MTTFDPTDTDDLRRRVDALVSLAHNDAACLLLGVDTSLEPQLDLTFVDDPLAWLAYDLAAAVKNANAEEAGEEEEPGPTLTTLVAEIKLLEIMSGPLDKEALIRSVLEAIQEEEEEGDH